MATVNAPDATPVDPPTGIDETLDTGSCAAELLKAGDVAAARKVIEEALSRSPANQELLWVMADIEFTDCDLLAGMGRLAEAVKAAGQDAAAVSRRIKVLSGNRLWREALAAIENIPDQLRDAPEVREVAGDFYEERGCRGHAFHSYGDRLDLRLSPEARSRRLRSWLFSGGPFVVIRRRVSAWEESKLLTVLRRSIRSAQLDTVPGLTGSEVFRLKAMIENSIYEWALCNETRRTAMAGLWLFTLATILPVWLVLFAVAKTAAFVPGPVGMAMGSFTSTGIAFCGAAFVLIGAGFLLKFLTKFLMRSRSAHDMRTLMRRWLYVLCVVTVGAEFAAAIAYNNHEVLPTAGESAWLVLGLVAIPAYFVLWVAYEVIIFVLALRIVDGLLRKNCQFVLIDMLLSVLQGMQSPSRRCDIAQRREWAEWLESAAGRARKDLLPSSFLSGVGAGEWLQRRVAGWAEAFHYMQRDVVAQVPGGQQKLESLMRHQIRCLATGDLGALAWRQPPPSPPRRVALWRMAAATLRTVLVAGLPLAVVLATQSIWHFSVGDFRWATIATGAWGLLYVMICLDPAIRDKIETARSLAGMLHQARGTDPLD